MSDPADASPLSAGRRRLRLVVPRYGAEVGGGSETLVRRLARALHRRGWDVEVWTTTAGDEETWSAAFPAGDDLDEGVRVRRFAVVGRRRPRLFHHFSRGVFRLPPGLRPETAWVVAQGPYAPGLVRALATGTDRPTVFMPYLYHPAIWGLPAAPHPRLLIPAAHDEPALRLRAVGRAIGSSDGLWYSTEEERTLLESVQPSARTRPHEVGTVAVDPPAEADPEGFRRRHGLARFLLYGGRSTPGKGLDLLLDGFAELRRRGQDVRLVLTGDAGDIQPSPPGVIALGRLGDAELWSALAACTAVVVPSAMESLSMLALEAWSMGRPCLVNSDSPVLAAQALRSGGGLGFQGAAGLADAAGHLLDHAAEADRLGAAGRGYVAVTYRWGPVVRRLERLLDATAGAGRSRGAASEDPG